MDADLLKRLEEGDDFIEEYAKELFAEAHAADALRARVAHLEAVRNGLAAENAICWERITSYAVATGAGPVTREGMSAAVEALLAASALARGYCAAVDGCLSVQILALRDAETAYRAAKKETEHGK